MIHIEFDPEACIGAGICESIADDIFHVKDDDGQMELIADEVDEDRRQQVETAVLRCPAGAFHTTNSP